MQPPGLVGKHKKVKLSNKPLLIKKNKKVLALPVPPKYLQDL
jgi:hypothetical protein